VANGSNIAEPQTAGPDRNAQPDFDAIVEAIVYLYTESRRITKGIAGRYGLTGPQLAVVKMLEPVGKLSLSELSAQIRARNSTVTGIIDRMEREGLVVRRRSDEDRRVVNIELTAKGQELAGEISVEPVQIFRQVLSELSARDSNELRRILNKLARRVRDLVNEGTEGE
jgi:DNA-binding MarR family transcriptional regulator